MSALGVKATGAALFALGRGICVTCSLRFTAGVIPADLLVRLKTGIYCAATASVCNQANTMPTELCRIGFLNI